MFQGISLGHSFLFLSLDSKGAEFIIGKTSIQNNRLEQIPLLLQREGSYQREQSQCSNQMEYCIKT